MNKKVVLPIVIVLLLLIAGGIFYYIYSNKIQVDKEGGVLTKKDDIVNQEVSYEKDGVVFRFNKNRVTKTANTEMQYGLSDTDEFSDFLGDKVTTAPFLIDLLCSSINQAFFDPAKLQEATSEAEAKKAKNLTDDSEFKSALEGYKVVDFKMQFNDKESGEQIAACQSNQKGFENIKFTAYRDYSGYPSFLGYKIGEVPK